MRHKESETTETLGEHIYSWNMTSTKAATRLISPGERKKIVNYLEEQGAKPHELNNIKQPRTLRLGEKTEIWHISDNEPLFIHTRFDYRINKLTIRLNSSTATAKEMIENKIIKTKE